MGSTEAECPRCGNQIYVETCDWHGDDFDYECEHCGAQVIVHGEAYVEFSAELRKEGVKQ